MRSKRGKNTILHLHSKVGIPFLARCILICVIRVRTKLESQWYLNFVSRFFLKFPNVLFELFRIARIEHSLKTSRKGKIFK